MIHVKKSILYEFKLIYSVPVDFIVDKMDDNVMIVVDNFVNDPYVCDTGEHKGVYFTNMEDFRRIYCILMETYKEENKNPKLFVERVIKTLAQG